MINGLVFMTGKIIQWTCVMSNREWAVIQAYNYKAAEVKTL